MLQPTPLRFASPVADGSGKKHVPTSSKRPGVRRKRGLRDAALHRDHTNKYRGRSPIILERYLMGFQDARALMRVARVTQLHSLFRKENITLDLPLPESIHYRAGLSRRLFS